MARTTNMASKTGPRVDPIPSAKAAPLLVFHTGERVVHYAIGRKKDLARGGSVTEIEYLTLVRGPNSVDPSRLPPPPADMEPADWHDRFFASDVAFRNRGPEVEVVTDPGIANRLCSGGTIVAEAQSVPGLMLLKERCPAQADAVERRIAALRK